MASEPRAQKLPTELGLMQVQIAGLSDLIVQAPRERGLSPAEEFERTRYKDEHGRDCLLAAAVKGALVEAAQLHGWQRAGFRIAVFVCGERIPLEYAECLLREDVVIVNGRHVIWFRPAYRDWTATLALTYDIGRIAADELAALLHYAGDAIGIHEWRPARGGEYGRFAVRECTVERVS
jgi:hypothetical protein